MKKALLSIVWISLFSYASQLPNLPRMKARILANHQSFLDEKNEHYTDLPEHLIALSFRCADKRDLKACSALVKNIKVFVEQQKVACPTIIEHATCSLIGYQCAMKKHAACVQDADDACACEHLREEAADMFFKLTELNTAQACCLGIKGEFLPLLVEYSDDACTVLYRLLSERRRLIEHDRPTLLFRAQRLYYAVREYRMQVKRSDD